MTARPLRSITFVLALAGAATAVGGCAAAQGATTTVELELHFSRFDPVSVTVPAGRPVTFVLRNTDPIDHEWIVGDEAVHERHRDGTEPVHDRRPTEVSVPALETRETSVTFDRPGTYRFVCHLPGHEAYGSVGVLVAGS